MPRSLGAHAEALPQAILFYNSGVAPSASRARPGYRAVWLQCPSYKTANIAGFRSSPFREGWYWRCSPSMQLLVSS